MRYLIFSIFITIEGIIIFILFKRIKYLLNEVESLYQYNSEITNKYLKNICNTGNMEIRVFDENSDPEEAAKAFKLEDES